MRDPEYAAKDLVVVDDDVDVHNTSEGLFCLCANTDPQRDSIYTKGPSDVLDHATSETALPSEIGHSRWAVPIGQDYFTGRGSKLGIDATKKLPGEGFKRPWPPLIRMDEAVKAKVRETHGAKQLNIWMTNSRLQNEP